MGYFRKKPVVIEAELWDGTLRRAREIASWSADAVAVAYTELRIKTLEGEMAVLPGDWIIKGVKGEFYPCKPDIFEQTYEPVNSPTKGE